MIKENHYKSLKVHISNLIAGISEHQDDIPANIIDQISEEYFCSLPFSGSMKVDG